MLCSVQCSTGVSPVSFGSSLDPSTGETPVLARASTKSVEGFFGNLFDFKEPCPCARTNNNYIMKLPAKHLLHA
jgi:hypothetical protein